MSQQLSFDDIFAAEAEEAATKHLPGEMEQAIPFYRALIDRFHVELMKADFDGATKTQKEADDLAYKLNGYNPGIMANDDSPAYVLERGTAAKVGDVPLWGQTGEFVITVRGAKVRIEMDGMYGIGAMPIPGFSAHAIEGNKPFISETGYRSFCGYNPTIEPGMTPDVLATKLIEAYLDRDCKGKLKPIKPEYRERFAAEAPAP